jgi:hypothetical protein
MMNTDTVGAASNSPIICGVKSYSTGFSWLKIITPADPLSQTFELQVNTDNYNLADTLKVDLLISFTNANYASTLTQTLYVKLLHPCTSTVINPAVIPTLTFTIGDAKKIIEFMQMTDSIASQYNIPKFCGERKYELTENLPFISLIFPDDPWESSTKIVLTTTDETKIGQYSVNLKASLVSYAAVSKTILISVAIKQKSANKLPYIFPKLVYSAQIIMTKESQPWSMNLS